jgi:hypothetical protein
MFRAQVVPLLFLMCFVTACEDGEKRKEPVSTDDSSIKGSVETEHGSPSQPVSSASPTPRSTPIISEPGGDGENLPREKSDDLGEPTVPDPVLPADAPPQPEVNATGGSSSKKTGVGPDAEDAETPSGNDPYHPGAGAILAESGTKKPASTSAISGDGPDEGTSQTGEGSGDQANSNPIRTGTEGSPQVSGRFDRLRTKASVALGTMRSTGAVVYNASSKVVGAIFEVVKFVGHVAGGTMKAAQWIVSWIPDQSSPPNQVPLDNTAKDDPALAEVEVDESVYEDALETASQDQPPAVADVARVENESEGNHSPMGPDGTVDRGRGPTSRFQAGMGGVKACGRMAADVCYRLGSVGNQSVAFAKDLAELPQAGVHLVRGICRMKPNAKEMNYFLKSLAQGQMSESVERELRNAFQENGETLNLEQTTKLCLNSHGVVLRNVLRILYHPDNIKLLIGEFSKYANVCYLHHLHDLYEPIFIRNRREGINREFARTLDSWTDGATKYVKVVEIFRALRPRLEEELVEWPRPHMHPDTLQFNWGLGSTEKIVLDDVLRRLQEYWKHLRKNNWDLRATEGSDRIENLYKLAVFVEALFSEKKKEVPVASPEPQQQNSDI